MIFLDWRSGIRLAKTEHLLWKIESRERDSHVWCHVILVRNILFWLLIQRSIFEIRKKGIDVRNKTKIRISRSGLREKRRSFYSIAIARFKGNHVTFWHQYPPNIITNISSSVCKISQKSLVSGLTFASDESNDAPKAPFATSALCSSRRWTSGIAEIKSRARSLMITANFMSCSKKHLEFPHLKLIHRFNLHQQQNLRTFHFDSFPIRLELQRFSLLPAPNRY